VIGWCMSKTADGGWVVRAAGVGDGNLGALAPDTVALPGDDVRAVLVHRGHRSGPGRLADDRSAASRDRCCSRGCGAQCCRGRWGLLGGVADRACGLHRARRGAAHGTGADPGAGCIDETRRGKPRWVRDSDTEPWRRVDPYDTGFVDRAGPVRSSRSPSGQAQRCQGSSRCRAPPRSLVARAGHVARSCQGAATASATRRRRADRCGVSGWPTAAMSIAYISSSPTRP
jgi:hypothetical protein